MTDILFAYPGGRAGAALLLLRTSLILFLLTTSATYGTDPWVPMMTVLVVIPLALGIATRWIAAICGSVILILVWPMGILPTASCLTGSLNALALAMIGPGLYSLDALIFGRRTLHLPE